MKNSSLFITTASWEPRFSDGVKEAFATSDFSSVLCFWFEEYGERTAEARASLADLCQSRNFLSVPLRFFSEADPQDRVKRPAHASTWRAIHKALGEALPGLDSFILDITTMPREVLWITLDLLTECGIPGAIIYHAAVSHGSWCGCEPEPPHIVPKLGGLPLINRPTKLLIASGYDEDRSEQFISTYEPIETLILFQDGVNEENVHRNEKQHKLRFGNRGASLRFESVDFYSADWGTKRTIEIASSFADGGNLILASLGPKPSAVALFEAHRLLPTSSLAYAPCRNYNPEYSVGMKQVVSIEWNGGIGDCRPALGELF